MRTEPWPDSADLQPRLPDRIATALSRFRPSGRRVRALRRLVAAALLVTAGVMAAMAPTPADEGTAVLAVVRDLPAGAALQPNDIEIAAVRSPPDGTLSPNGREDLGGTLLAGPVRRGEILTDARVLGDRGPDPGPGRAAVPVPFADPTIASLLAPGMHVVLARLPDRDRRPDAVDASGFGADGRPGASARDSPESDLSATSPEVTVLAADAVVLSMADPGVSGITGSQNRVVVVGVALDAADAVSAAAATGAITIRFGP